MGFGTIIGQIIFFMVLILVVANFLIFNEANIKTYSEARKTQSEILYNKENSNIEITNYTIYGTSWKNLSIIVKNKGKLKLDKDLFNLYLNNNFVDKNNYSVNIIDVINPGIVDPGESINITYFNISSGTYYVSVVNEFSSKASEVIEVS